MKNQEQKTILLVEDDITTMMVETHQLKSFGYDVVPAKSGEEAVQIAIGNDKIDLILMDIEMGSGMDGAEAARQILGNRNLPIVFLTVHTDKEYVERIKGIAGYGYVVKNSSNVVIQSSIEMAFNLFKAGETLRESEARYKTLITGAPEGILVVDLQTKQFHYANPAICEMFGYTEEEFVRLSVVNIHPKESLDHLLAEFESHARGEKRFSPNLQCLRKDGTLFYADISGTNMILDGHECRVGFFTDITERKRMEEEIIKISTLEKQGIARDLHDGLAQQLAGAAYLCHVLRNQMTSASQKKVVKEIDAVLHQCLQQIRNVANGLLPVGLEDAGLIAVLQHLAEMISQMFSVNCRLEQSGDPVAFDLKTSTHLYYLVHEAVMNAVRHGSPRNIVISFSYRLEQLTVQDDGSGFDLLSDEKGSMGLQIMRYRADIIGGVLAIDSHKGGGTCIRCKFARQHTESQYGRLNGHA